MPVSTLAAFDASNLAVLIPLVIFLALSLFAKIGQRRLKSWVEVRDGRVVVRDEIRMKLERTHPERLQRIEAMIAKSYTVNEKGKVAVGEPEEPPAQPPAGAQPPAATQPPATAQRPAPAAPRPAPSTPDAGDDRFQSIWEEQDTAPSIWDDKDKADFWGKSEKRER